MYCDPSIAVAGKRPVRSENIALSRRSDGGTMQVWRTVVGSSWSSYWSRDSVPPGAGGSGEVSSAGDEARTDLGAGGRLEFDRVVANASCFGFLLSDVLGLVNLMLDLDAVM
jgi:hypothetical protein